MPASGALLRPALLRVDESLSLTASSLHTQRSSMTGAVNLPLRTLLRTRLDWLWMRFCPMLHRFALTFTVVGKIDACQAGARRVRLLRAIC